MNFPVFTISLDFELMWGVKDHRTIQSYGKNILGAREAIPKILQLFDRYEVHATWATVGFLFYKSMEELLSHLPGEKPHYNIPTLSNYNGIENIGHNEAADPFHYGNSIIENIARYKGQEIATHTFSHYYCLEKGPSLQSFEEDISAAIETGKASGHKITSIVFPRNQYSEQHIRIAAANGITAIRGNGTSWIYKPRNREEENTLHRLLRLLDTYINLTGFNLVEEDKLADNLFDVPASRFLRPYNSSLSFLEPLKLTRIKRSMTEAARQNKIYHLWWHPHNFGVNTSRNLQQLESILQHFSHLKKHHGMKSLSMSEIVAEQIAHGR